MTKAPLPKRLRRSGVKLTFPKVSEATWDNLFDNEKNNGLHAMRVSGPDKYAYYDIDGLMKWLVQRGWYRTFDFHEYGEILYQPSNFTVRRHAIAG